MPRELPGTCFRNILTDVQLSTVPRNGIQVLPLGDIFSDCPVAMLERVT